MLAIFKTLSTAAAFVALAAAGLNSAATAADPAEVKEKPRLYSYFAAWTYPRADWPSVGAESPALRDLINKSLASGKLVAVGDGYSLMHQKDGWTHVNWWSSMSVAGLLTYLDEEGAIPGGAILEKATKHADYVVASRYYNHRPATVKNGYLMFSSYELKADAPDNALTTISKNIATPVLEKLLADGVIVEYQIAAEEFQTGSAREFFIEWIANTADAVDKADAAWRDAAAKSPLFDAAKGYVDWDKESDRIYHVDATLK